MAAGSDSYVVAVRNEVSRTTVLVGSILQKSGRASALVSLDTSRFSILTICGRTLYRYYEKKMAMTFMQPCFLVARPFLSAFAPPLDVRTSHAQVYY